MYAVHLYDIYTVLYYQRYLSSLQPFNIALIIRIKKDYRQKYMRYILNANSNLAVCVRLVSKTLVGYDNSIFSYTKLLTHFM